MKSFLFPEFAVIRDQEKCNQCRGCERQCSFGTHIYNEKTGEMTSDETKCAGCQRCVIFCPRDAVSIRPTESFYRPHANWSREKLEDLKRQAETGGVILAGSGTDKPFRIYWDHIVLNASQVTNPSIDPLREPMELRTFLGSKPDLLNVKSDLEATGRTTGSADGDGLRVKATRAAHLDSGGSCLKILNPADPPQLGHDQQGQ